MTSGNRSANVALALEMLHEEVEKEIDVANRAVANALARGGHGEAEKSLQRSKALTAFRDKVAALEKEWPERSVSVEQSRNEKIRRSNGRLPPGERTPEVEFVTPLLRVLEEMGGSGKAGAVVERVGRVMDPALREWDYEPLESDGKPRWEKAVHWARRQMVMDGLLNPDSRRGIWELSEKGREELHDLP